MVKRQNVYFVPKSLSNKKNDDYDEISLEPRQVTQRTSFEFGPSATLVLIVQDSLRWRLERRMSWRAWPHGDYLIYLYIYELQKGEEKIGEAEYSLGHLYLSLSSTFSKIKVHANPGWIRGVPRLIKRFCSTSSFIVQGSPRRRVERKKPKRACPHRLSFETFELERTRSKLARDYVSN